MSFDDHVTINVLRDEILDLKRSVLSLKSKLGRVKKTNETLMDTQKMLYRKLTKG